MIVLLLSALQVRAELNTAESSLATATADRLQLQQELSSKSDQLMLLESELRLKTSRLDAAQQQLATEAEEHAAERALLQRQLEQLMVREAPVWHTTGKGRDRSWNCVAVCTGRSCCRCVYVPSTCCTCSTSVLQRGRSLVTGSALRVSSTVPCQQFRPSTAPHVRTQTFNRCCWFVAG